jgi:hypothetical protein
MTDAGIYGARAMARSSQREARSPDEARSAKSGAAYPPGAADPGFREVIYGEKGHL